MGIFGSKKSGADEPSKHRDEPLDGNKPKKKGRLDRWVMGMIIGSAIGSVIGMALAPKSGKETRKLIKQKGRKIYREGQEITQKIRESAREHIQQPVGTKRIPHEDVEAANPDEPRSVTSEE